MNIEKKYIINIKPQIIKKGNSLEYAVIPYQEFLKMKEMIMDYEDLMLLRDAKSQDRHKKSISAISLLSEIENS